MVLRRLRVARFRCLDSVDIELSADRNFLFGRNGAGKTSLLEAIHVLGRGRSFRTRQTARLVQRGAESFRVIGELASERSHTRIDVGFERGSMDLKINGRPGSRASQLADYLPVHVIDPGAHALIDGGPSHRRRFVDWGVFHVEHTYLVDWRQYRRALAQRNAALKAAADADALGAWTAQLLDAAARVTARREAYVAALEEEVRGLSERLLGERLSIGYLRGWRKEQTLADVLDQGLEHDRRVGRTEGGPHRADLRLSFNGGQVKDEASRGQQKLIAAVLILAQVRLFSAMTEDGGLLLVDDPSAELDGDAFTRLRSELERLSAQIVMTGLDTSRGPVLPGARLFHVEQGRIDPVYTTVV